MRKGLVNKQNRETLEWLAKVRWPNGVSCPTCGAKDCSFIETRGIYQCNGCRKQFSVFAQTAFQHMRLSPADLIYYALWFWKQSANNCNPRYSQNPETAERGWRGPIGIRSLSRQIGSYSTAHRLHKKLIRAFENEETTQDQFLANLFKKP